MKQYHDLCKTVLKKANIQGHLNEKDIQVRKDRTGTGTIGVFGYQMRFNLQEGFPLLTTKKLNFNLIASELLWFLKGDTNIRFLLENKNNIWNEWAFKNWVESEDYDAIDMTDFGIRSQHDPVFKQLYLEQMNIFKQRVLEDDEFAHRFGDLGPVYGKQWRSWEGQNGETFDQLHWIVEEIRGNPQSRRLILNSWNVARIPFMSLPPCHTMVQFYVEDGKLSCQLYQRSGDIFLGIPFNIASYALLTHIVAQVTGLKVGEFIHTIGDAHIYLNHLEQIRLQLTKEFYPLPSLKLNPFIRRIEDFTMSDVQIVGYQAHPHIKGKVAV
ncbi:thymidylate synthase [Paenibacillus sp. 1182]|uniref:thymidylate synthase n=1 Tax=Paenibacillus sp. 1182 TaxID=2806565 RepID=UPI001AE64140|nr:thymidylate synthase [Paenibacillus sp. 1182]MBP1308834.1 thymidylate synthase [Paenibacillus sp. 1182]